MATVPLRKKQAKRSNYKPHSSMASLPLSKTMTAYRKTYLIISVTLIFFVVMVLGISSNTWRSPSTISPKIYSIEVVNEFPHDPRAFTQGLLYAGNDTLFESTGLYGKSSVRKVDLKTGKIEVIQRMDGSYFGEGLTLLGERLFQVTWLKKTGFIYDRRDLREVKKFTHQMTDGWGLATDGKVLFGSDGTSVLYLIDPQTFKVISKHIVKYKGHEVHNLNELEFINGEVWANVWQTDCIARISHQDGSVLGWILLPTLREELERSWNKAIDVLNGIAWDGTKNRIFVTGKLWPKLFEIKVHPAEKHYSDGAIEKMCLTMPSHFV